MNLVGVGWGVWAVIGGIFLILGILPLLFVHIIVRADEKKKGSSRISVGAIGRFRVAGAGNWQ